MDTWTLEAATTDFPEIVRRALDHQPQVVVRGDDEDAVVVVARSEYERLQGPERVPPPTPSLRSGQDFLTFMQNSPLAAAVAAGEIDLDTLRDSSPPRVIDFD